MRIERQTLAQQVLDRLVLRLLEGQLKPGDRVSTEQDLMEEFGVSRSSVREAVKALQNLGILESRPALGTFLSLKEDSYSRLLLLASLLSQNTENELLEITLALNSHSLLLLQNDLLNNEVPELHRQANEYLLELEASFEELRQFQATGSSKKMQLQAQSKMLSLLSGYPTKLSLTAKISSNLETFLAQQSNPVTSLSTTLIGRYENIVAAIRTDTARLSERLEEQAQLLSQDSKVG